MSYEHNTMKNAIHAVIQGKGGIGKSLIASTIAQYIRSKGHEPACFDTDQENTTFHAYKDLNVKLIDLSDENRVIDQGKFDQLIEQLLETESPCVIDSGANTFSPFCAYLLDNEVIGVLEGSGKPFYIHTIVGGGDVLEDTANGFESLISAFPTAKIVLWKNLHYGELVLPTEKRTSWEKTKMYQDNQEHLYGEITLTRRNPQTYGEDIKRMNAERLTLQQVITGTSFPIMSKQRIQIVFREIFEQLDNVNWSNSHE
ncbi:conjugal transfer protein TraL [Klebsiella oxytoca]|uniref:nucleotide-binding protein n=1 Tax=Klebsiella oxytoca TaxID=571 RepID=UPI00254C7B51|nr:conjugal transfer protein TraL [Klebsiella oxytoca]MEC5509916.1 conjugal transfer protein TraL [Klebsiella oxytoca]